MPLDAVTTVVYLSPQHNTTKTKQSAGGNLSPLLGTVCCANPPALFKAQHKTMPNHFLTIGLCARDYKRLEDAGKEDFDEVGMGTIVDANLCELVFKMPVALNCIVASGQGVRYKHKQTGEIWGDCNGPTGDDRDQWEAVNLTAEEIADLSAKYGATNWFDWCVDNWGTKWGTYRTKFYELGGDGSPILIEFQTAWRPPLPNVMRMIDDYICKTYFLKDIKWLGHQPYDNTTTQIEIDEVK